MSQMQEVGANILIIVGGLGVICGLFFTFVSAASGDRWARWTLAALLGCVIVFAVLAVSGVLG